MKDLKTLIAVVSFTVVAGTINAQEAKIDKAPMSLEMKQQIKLARQKLALTPEQEPKFKEISMKYGEKMRAVKNSEGEKKAKLLQMKELKAAKTEEMKGILTPEQFMTYTQMKEERAEMKKELRKVK